MAWNPSDISDFQKAVLQIIGMAGKLSKGVNWKLPDRFGNGRIIHRKTWSATSRVSVVSELYQGLFLSTFGTIE